MANKITDSINSELEYNSVNTDLIDTREGGQNGCYAIFIEA